MDGVTPVTDFFLEQCVKLRAICAVYLHSGTKLEGRITHFDREGIVLTSAGSVRTEDMLVFRSQIASTCPRRLIYEQEKK